VSKPTAWKRTGDCRIAPWWFGIMRAEFMERRDFPGYNNDWENGTFQTRWVGAGRFPIDMDQTSPFGFWSTMSTPVGDTQTYGDRALWRGFITYFKGNTPIEQPCAAGTGGEA
jgi:hypothetical protein